jgi:hypothetical protein
VAAGQNTVTNDSLLFVSLNTSTGIFTEQGVNGAPASGVYYGASCTGGPATTPASTVCIAVGQNLSTMAPLISVTNDGASATWAVVTSITGAPANGVFNAASCTGKMPNTVCIATGQIQPPTGGPFIAYSTDGSAAVWQVATNFTGTLPTNASLASASCTGSNNTAVCTASGLNNSANTPLLLTSNNSGVNWNVVTTINGTSPITSGQFYGTSTNGGSLRKSMSAE